MNLDKHRYCCNYVVEPTSIQLRVLLGGVEGHLPVSQQEKRHRHQSIWRSKVTRCYLLPYILTLLYLTGHLTIVRWHVPGTNAVLKTTFRRLNQEKKHLRQSIWCSQDKPSLFIALHLHATYCSLQAI